MLRTAPDLDGPDGGDDAGGDGFAQYMGLPLREAKQALCDQFERRYLQRMLDDTGGNVAEAARRAGVDRVTIFRGIRRGRWSPGRPPRRASAPRCPTVSSASAAR